MPQAAVPFNNSPYSDLPPIISELFAAKARKGGEHPPINYNPISKPFTGLSFEQIAKAVGKDEVWLAAAFYGQAKFTPEDLQKVAQVLGITTESIQNELGEHWWPNRGLGPVPPTDPVIYRLYEGVLVYGHAIKAVIHEKFGDGIMSMIDCKVTVDKKPDPKGDRVELKFDGKFLPYAKW